MSAQEQLKKSQELGARLERISGLITEVKDGQAAVKLALMTTEMKRWKREAKNLSRKLKEAQDDAAGLRQKMRAYCDVTEQEWESPESLELRKEVWNDEDTAERFAIDSVYEDSVQMQEQERSWRG